MFFNNRATEKPLTNISAACSVTSGSITGFFFGDIARSGARRGERGAVSSKKGFVERGRVLAPGFSEELSESVIGDAARFLKGLLDPRLTAPRGEGSWSGYLKSLHVSPDLASSMVWELSSTSGLV